MKKKLIYEYKTDELGKISELKISYNLKTIKGIGRWQQLKKLDLSDNNLRDIPEKGINKLSALESFDISNNSISKLPKAILNLSKLKELKLNNNKLIEIPVGLNKLTNLEVLELKNNNLNSLNIDFNCFPKLKKIVVDNNPVPANKLFDTQKIVALIQVLEFKHQQLKKQIIELSPYVQKVLSLKQSLEQNIKLKQTKIKESDKQLLNTAENFYSIFNKITHNSELISSNISKYKIYVKNVDISQIMQIQKAGASKNTALIEELYKQLSPLKVKLIKLANKFLDIAGSSNKIDVKANNYGLIDKVIR